MVYTCSELEMAMLQWEKLLWRHTASISLMIPHEHWAQVMVGGVTEQRFTCWESELQSQTQKVAIRSLLRAG